MSQESFKRAGSGNTCVNKCLKTVTGVARKPFRGGTERPLKGLATEALGEGGPKGRLTSGEGCRKGRLSHHPPDRPDNVSDNKNRRGQQEHPHPVAEAEAGDVEERAGEGHDQDLAEDDYQGDPDEACAE